MQNLPPLLLKSLSHDQLVKIIIGLFRKIACDEVYADLKGYGKPAKVGRHIPDASGYKKGKKALIGEAKLGDDLYSQRTTEQFIDFSKNPGIVLIILVYKKDYEIAQRRLRNLKLLGRKNIILLHY